MRTFIATPMFQSVATALARGFVGAVLAYFAFLFKHVHDYETIIGTCGFILFVPLAGLLHLVVPSVPGLTSMAQWPRLAPPPAPDMIPATMFDPPTVQQRKATKPPAGE